MRTHESTRQRSKRRIFLGTTGTSIPDEPVGGQRGEGGGSGDGGAVHDPDDAFAGSLVLEDDTGLAFEVFEILKPRSALRSNGMFRMQIARLVFGR